uniref:Crp/Fnr family transcriptional regulator n=1 Tax=Desulfosarcina sp. TaxID=2027861 RepID=UPI00356710C5
LEHYDFRPLMQGAAGKFASIGWLCIAERYRRHRGILPALFKMIVRETKKRGVQHLIAPLHPPILPLLERFGAKAVAEAFFSEELQVSMVPIHINYGDLPPGLREFSQDPFQILFEDSNQRRIYRQGETIIEKGKPGTDAFLIMRGAVEVLAHPGVQQTQRAGVDGVGDGTEGNPLLGQGQVFGELSLMDGGPRTATVICHSKEVDLMVWTREQLFQQLGADHQKAIQLCKILASRLRTEVEGYQKNQSHEALVATIILDASREANRTVSLKWLASQCGFRGKEMQALMTHWAEDGLVDWEGAETIQVTHIERLKEKMIWK